MNLKKKIVDSIVREIEINLPYFTKKGNYYFMVFTEKEDRGAICVFDSEFNPSIAYGFTDNALSGDAEQSTKEEFLRAYESAKCHFEKIVNKIGVKCQE